MSVTFGYNSDLLPGGLPMYITVLPTFFYYITPIFLTIHYVHVFSYILTIFLVAQEYT